MAVTSIEPSLFASLEPPRLAGAKCPVCATVTFPVQGECPRGDGSIMEVIELPDCGTLWTWTVQSFEPKPPYRAPAGGFKPFGVGYVDLGDVIVEGRLTGKLEDLGVGTPMKLSLLDLWPAVTGEQIVTYAFHAEERS
ncbi:OB-fold domain-containing protein [Aeromicrobium sp.]|uniref:Zn-ribbon domain-containing OB-fold protein n=1 Tax=Aeromicrobium sp. TaxID=1871063 RepID=UPI0019877984|nr:OB-fold domain-containing protein [Aeromicrobium sp.]MBC7632253.1 OB-fold domain-containing protein [Aeromicrobium sp.]